MNQEKIGKFIAECRKKKKITQQELAEKLGVSDRTIGNWENGRNMPDLSLFKPLCNELDITLNDLMSGEKVKEKEYQKKFEENIVNTIDYTNKELYRKNKLIAEMLMFFGIDLTFIAFSIFPSESSWGSIYSIIGLIISLIGFSKLNKKKSFVKKLLLNVGYLGLCLILLIGIDYSNVKLNHTPPRFSYLKETGDNMIVYKAPFYNVYRINRNTKNEYYIIDTKKQYTANTVPISPFNRNKSGIENIIKYKNKYIGNNSNDSYLIGNLPLSEYGYVFEIDSINLGLTIDYHITDWYINENQYLEKCLIYNTVSIFALIDNVEQIIFNFSGNSYIVTRNQIEELYPNYDEIVSNEINQNNFYKYLENKMNDNEFIKSVFEEIFIK